MARPNPLHLEVHPDYVEGCLVCKMGSVRLHSAALRASNDGTGPTSGMTDREYARTMFESRRAAGRPDPEPATKQAARLAPKKGIFK